MAMTVEVDVAGVVPQRKPRHVDLDRHTGVVAGLQRRRRVAGSSRCVAKFRRGH
jgi:hypothetical protein